jgi:hypothetical protein
MSKEVKEILDRQERLGGDRGTWEGHWQELAEIMLPRRPTFTTEGQPGACAEGTHRPRAAPVRRGRGGGCSECGRREKRRRTDPRGARVTPRRWTSNPRAANAGPAPPGPRKTYVAA